MKHFVICFLLFLLPSREIFAVSENDTIPEVHFVVIRLDYLTYTIKGFYEFSQSYRKSLPEEEYVAIGNIFYKKVPAGDFGFTEVQSRLTGERLLHAATVWAGSGAFIYPPDSLFSTSWKQGYENPNPDTLIFVPLFGSTTEQADSAWNAVRGTDIIKRLAGFDIYEAVIFDHFYSVGMSNPYTAEWFVIAYTHPLAPDDMAFVKMVWPRTIITGNVPTTPEIIIHNFSDSDQEVDVQLEISSSSGTLYKSTQQVGVIPADSSQLITFDPIIPSSLDSMVMSFVFQNPGGSHWEDAYPENDMWEQKIKVTDQPVFRPISSIKHPGSIPVRGIALDFDGDGDVDVFQYGYIPKLWQNDGTGNFVDITDLINVDLGHHPRLAVAEDFNGDAFIDLIVVYFDKPPLFLVGNGIGVFEDFTVESGLSNIIGYWGLGVLDKENDNDQDLIFQSYEQEIVLENDGTGHFIDVTSESGIVDPSQTENISSGDLNGDGYPDVVLTNWENPPTVFINDGDGTFSFLEGPWDFIYGRMALIFDFDSDGLQDILFARRLYDEVSLLFKNLGDLTFEEVSSQFGGLPPSFYADASDFNGDGHPDLILDHLDSFTLLVNREGMFVDYTDLLIDMMEEFLFGAIGTSPRAQFIDLDGDGDIDIYSQMIVFENQGLNLSPVNIKPTRQPMPTSFRLYQNHPNPFNTATMISFELPQAAEVELVIFDILGREVETLVKGKVESGKHKVMWDASGKVGASGVYFYRLTAGNFMQTKKLILLR